MLSLADIASRWTECVALPAHNAELIIIAVDKVQKSLPFPLLGLDGEAAVKAMNQMYMANRLFINFFQPSFKLLDTRSIGGKTVRRHDAPKTPYNRLIELHTLRSELRCHFDNIIHALDPLKLLDTIRLYQHQLAQIAIGDPVGDKNSDLTAFLQGLSVVWQEGVVNPLAHQNLATWQYRITSQA